MANSSLTESSTYCRECGKKIKPGNLYGYCVAHRRLSAAHKAKHKTSSDAWEKRNRDRINEKARERYSANPDKFINKTKAYYAKKR